MLTALVIIFLPITGPIAAIIAIADPELFEELKNDVLGTDPEEEEPEEPEQPEEPESPDDVPDPEPEPELTDE